MAKLLGYEFVEMPNPERETNSDAVPFIRIRLDMTYSKVSYTRNIAEPVHERMGRYGIDWADISSDEDRRKWIAGGRTRIIDLESDEKIAERTGYVVSRIRDGRVVGDVWVTGIGSAYCPTFENEDYKTHWFLARVLKSAKDDGYGASYRRGRALEVSVC